MTDIGIVIVNYNVRHFLIQCLQSVRQSSFGNLTVEIWVVDNASVDGSCGVIKKDFPEVRLIENVENVGFSKANNQAIEHMNSRYILLLNPDTILEADTLKKCYDYMEQHEKVGALGVRMIDGNGVFLPESKRAIPNLWNSFCKLTFISKLFPKSRLFSGYNLGYIPEFETAEVEVLCGAFMFIRREVLAKTGLLDERFFMYGEDIDLSYRILSAGHAIVYYPETTIIHFKGESTKKASLQYVRTFYGAMSLYVNKHYSGRKSELFRWFILFAIQLRALVSLLAKFFNTGVKLLADGLVIFSMLHVIKSLWALYYFGDMNYYKDTSIDINIIIYTVLWCISSWFFGRYDRSVTWKRLTYGIVAGTLLILVLYALEAESYRTSRALIVLGGLGVWMYMLISDAFQKLFNKTQKTHKTVALVAYEEEAEKIKEMVKNQSSDSFQFHVIFPGLSTENTYFTNTLPNLEKTIHQLKADELIFSSTSLPMKDIMEQMTKLSRFVDFKIAGDEGLGLIGKKIPGKSLYHLDISFPLDDGFWRRVKWVSDIMISLIFIPFFPLLWIINGLDAQTIKNIFLVLIQKKTWVGYGGEPMDYTFLPPLPKAVIAYPVSEWHIEFQEHYFRDKNLEYAKSYALLSDLGILFKNITCLYGK